MHQQFHLLHRLHEIFNTQNTKNNNLKGKLFNIEEIQYVDPKTTEKKISCDSSKVL